MARSGNGRVSGKEGPGKPQQESIGLWLRGLGVRRPSLTLLSENTEEIDDTAARFLARIDRSSGPAACWPWTGIEDGDGYGRFYFAGREHRAHRIACMIAHGDPPEVDSQACHDPEKCSTRLCCNPGHLRWDSPANNQHDVRISGTRRGERNPKNVLTEAQVRAIWAEQGRGGYVLIARRLGLSEKAVRHVLAGTNWGWLTRTLPRPAPQIAAAILKASGVTP